ncbi:MAG: sigma-70 family RNA polymerase sigma factor [Clostridiales bacterium]|nr:sigma-70 family RNA polymerase sigma factor [Clostridiales bacterium]
MSEKEIEPKTLSDDERRAVEDIYKKYRKNVYEFFRRRVFLSHKAEELTSETFARVSENITRFMIIPEDERIKLLYGYAEKVFLMQSRTNASRKTDNFSDIEADGADGDVEQNIVSEEDVFEAAVKSEIVAAVKKEIDRLPPLKRKVMIMMYYEEMKTDDIARELDMDPSTLRSMISNTYKYLRKKLEK